MACCNRKLMMFACRHCWLIIDWDLLVCAEWHLFQWTVKSLIGGCVYVQVGIPVLFSFWDSQMHLYATNWFTNLQGGRGETLTTDVFTQVIIIRHMGGTSCSFVIKFHIKCCSTNKLDFLKKCLTGFQGVAMELLRCFAVWLLRCCWWLPGYCFVFTKVL